MLPIFNMQRYWKMYTVTGIFQGFWPNRERRAFLYNKLSIDDYFSKDIHCDQCEQVLFWSSYKYNS